MRGSGFVKPTTHEKTGASTKETKGPLGQRSGTSDEQSLTRPILQPNSLSWVKVSMVPGRGLNMHRANSRRIRTASAM